MKSVVTMVVLFLCVTKTVSLLSGSAQTSTQLLRKNSCELNMTSFETIMEKYKAYGEDRLLVVGMFEASAGTGKSTAASLVVGCPNAYHSGGFPLSDIVKMKSRKLINNYCMHFCSLHERWRLDKRCPH